MKEINVQSQTIDKLIYKIEEGEVKIPAFQRGFVWEQTQVIDLLDSIYRDYPIGSILFWNTTIPLNSARNVAGILLPNKNLNYPVNYVLDGQQRLSSLYAIFCNKQKELIKEVSDVKNPDLQMFDICFDIKRKIFIHSSEIVTQSRYSLGLFSEQEDSVAGRYVKMETIFNISSFIKQIREFDEPSRQIAEEMLSKFKNYDIPIITIKGNEISEVGVIFERINNTGIKLTTLDLKIAQTWDEKANFDFRKKIKKLVAEIEKKFGLVNEKNILQCICAVIKGTAKTKDILELTSDEIIGKFNVFEKSIKLAIDYIATNFKVHNESFLPQAHQIVGLCYFFSVNKYPSPTQRKAIQQWFWLTSFSKRYASSTDEKMNEDIEFFKDIIGERNKDSIRKYFKHEIDWELFRSESFSRAGANSYTRAFILLLCQKDPKSLLNHTKIDVTNALSPNNDKEYHHIFPQAFLRRRGVRSINVLANVCILPSSHNKKISDNPPSVYLLKKDKGLFEVLNEYVEEREQDLLTVLESNFMPVDLKIYEHDNYDDFLEKRSKLLYELYQKLTRG